MQVGRVANDMAALNPKLAVGKTRFTSFYPPDAPKRLGVEEVLN